jgi:VanZ family protein
MSARIIRIILLLALAGGIMTLSLLPEVPVDVRFLMGLDKVQHWIAYAGLGFLVLLTINSSKRMLLFYYALAVFSCTMYGGLIEVLQGFTGRNPEVADFFVNLFGSASGGVFAVGFIQISRDRSRKKE